MSTIFEIDRVLKRFNKKNLLICIYKRYKYKNNVFTLAKKHFIKILFNIKHFFHILDI